MRIELFASLTLPVLVSADVCGDLQAHFRISFPSGSYEKNGVCHGLFWRTARGSGDICAHTSQTRETCPNTHKLYISEAIEIMAGVRGAPTSSSTTTTTTTTISTTTSTTSPATVSSSAPRRVVPVRGEDVGSTSPSYEILAFGDWGFQRRPHVLSPMARVIASRYINLDSVFLLGDNYYPSGISAELGLEDPAFALFRDILAPSTPVNFYPVLGNHDHLGSIQAQLDYSHVHPQWVFPARHYFKRLQGRGRLQVCAWFLDTDQELFDANQARWLEGSIIAEKDTCDWLVVSGHHPIFDAGEYRSNAYLIQHLLPILTRHEVNIYLSGHEHQSQVLYDGITTFFISGATGDIHNKPVRGHEHLQYINTREVAILRLMFFSDRAEFEFVGMHIRDAPVLHSGVVRK